jgi:hypothetical protein
MYQGYAQDAYRTVEAKTASYYCTIEDNGKVLTNRGASGAVTIHLPLNSSLPSGWWITVYAVANQNLIVDCNPTDTMAALNDATADSVALQTASEIIGGGFTFIWDGTGWLTLHHTEETQTVTVVTA